MRCLFPKWGVPHKQSSNAAFCPKNVEQAIFFYQRKQLLHIPIRLSNPRHTSNRYKIMSQKPHFLAKGDTPKKSHKPHATSVAHFHHPLVKANFVSLLLGGACVHPIVHFANPQLLHPVGHLQTPMSLGLQQKISCSLRIIIARHHESLGVFLCKSTEHGASHWLSKEVLYHLNTSHLRSEVGPGPPFPRPLQSGHWSNW